MLAEKFVLHADSQGRLTGLPNFAPNEEIEVIVVRKGQAVPLPRHKPSPMLAFQGAKLPGDDVAPAIGIEEWGELFQGDHVKHP